jgi:hypothetical protein
LREVHDGSWRRIVGTDGGQTLTWEGKMGLVGGCTPGIDSFHSVTAQLGERWLLYRCQVDEEKQGANAIAHSDKVPLMRKELSAAVRGVLGGLEPGRRVLKPEGADLERLLALARLVVKARSAVERESYSHEILYVPESEGPARLALSLSALRDSLLWLGVSPEQTWQLLTQTALSSMPAIRRTVLEILVGANDRITTKAAATRLGYPTSTVRRTLEDLTGHDVALRYGAEKPGDADEWEATPWTMRMWEAAAPSTTTPQEAIHGT